MYSKGKPIIKTFPLISLVSALLFLASGAVIGSEFKGGGDVTISSLHVIDDDLYVSGDSFDLDGRVVGDLFAASYVTIIRGQVNNSAHIFCGNVSHQGSIDGSLRVFGGAIDIEGIVGRSAELCATEVRLGSGSTVQNDLNILGLNPLGLFDGIVRLEGSVLGKTKLTANKVVISGSLGQDVVIKANEITVLPSATISGNLTYTTPREEDLQIADGADIHGEIDYRRQEVADEDSGTELILEVSYMLAAFLFGIIVVRLFRPYAEESMSQLKQHYVTAFASGLLGLIILGLCILVLVIALLAFLMGMLVLGSGSLVVLGVLFLVFSTLAIPISVFATVSGSIIYYCGNILIAFMLGYLIFSRVKRDLRVLGGLTLIVGLIILLVVYMIPYIGSVICTATGICGAGAILMGIRHCRRAKLNESP